MPSPLTRCLTPQDRTALFIDGANLYAAARALGVDIDYKKLLDEFKSNSNLLRAYYFTALLDEQDFSPLRPLVDWLDYNGYTVVTKPARDYTDSAGRRRIKGNMDVDISVTMLEMSAHLGHAVLFSGDGDFVSLVAALQRRGVRVSVVSTVRSHPPMAADELRRQADAFIDLADLAGALGRAPRERADRLDTPEIDPLR